MQTLFLTDCFKNNAKLNISGIVFLLFFYIQCWQETSRHCIFKWVFKTMLLQKIQTLFLTDCFKNNATRKNTVIVFELLFKKQCKPQTKFNFFPL